MRRNELRQHEIQDYLENQGLSYDFSIKKLFDIYYQRLNGEWLKIIKPKDGIFVHNLDG